MRNQRTIWNHRVSSAWIYRTSGLMRMQLKVNRKPHSLASLARPYELSLRKICVLTRKSDPFH
jgi:hypothetical protein